MPKNLFIVLDGMDGAGKGEMVSKLHSYLFAKDKRYSILTTREPTFGRYGAEIREILKKDNDPKENAEKLFLLYVKDRGEHLNNLIEPFLAKTSNGINIVLCDRYYYSTIAFQHAQGLPMDRVIEANKRFRMPDICFILDLPPKVALERITDSRKTREKFEKQEFMETLRKNFLSLREFLKDNIVVIDASKDIDFVFEQLKEEIDKIL